MENKKENKPFMYNKLPECPNYCQSQPIVNVTVTVKQASFHALAVYLATDSLAILFGFAGFSLVQNCMDTNV